MDKKVHVWLKNGDCFITNKGSFDYMAYGVNAVGFFDSDRVKGKEGAKDVIIPWANIAYVEKLVS